MDESGKAGSLAARSPGLLSRRVTPRHPAAAWGRPLSDQPLAVWRAGTL